MSSKTRRDGGHHQVVLQTPHPVRRLDDVSWLGAAVDEAHIRTVEADGVQKKLTPTVILELVITTPPLPNPC